MVASRALPMPLGVYFVIVFPLSPRPARIDRTTVTVYYCTQVKTVHRSITAYRAPQLYTGWAPPADHEPGISRDALEVSRLSALQNLNCVVRA